MTYAYRQFNTYAGFQKFLNFAANYRWSLHSWQDIGAPGLPNIKAIFNSQIGGALELPESYD